MDVKKAREIALRIHEQMEKERRVEDIPRGPEVLFSTAEMMGRIDALEAERDALKAELEVERWALNYIACCKLYEKPEVLIDIARRRARRALAEPEPEQLPAEGAWSEPKPFVCSTCGNTGIVYRHIPGFHGDHFGGTVEQKYVEEPCPTCYGAKEVNGIEPGTVAPCPDCQGGKEKKMDTKTAREIALKIHEQAEQERKDFYHDTMTPKERSAVLARLLWLAKKRQKAKEEDEAGE